ncbi:MAG: GerMN domain-containing protein, partial [Planctomycetota bacterium]
MPTALHRLALAGLGFLLPLPALVAQGTLFLHRGDLVQATPVDLDVRAAVERLCRGPTADERARGLETAVPPGTRLLDLRRDGAALTLVFDEPLLLAAALGRIETAIEQLTKTAFATANQRGIEVRAVHLRIRKDGVERDLSERLARGPAPTPATTTTPTSAGGTALRQVSGTGALSGMRIAISPGHGYYWRTTLGWTTQRGVIDGTVEDIHTAEICNDFVIPMLENMGAEIVLCRDHGEIGVEVIADNDQGAPTYTETGAWSTSTSQGYNGGGYRFASIAPTATATATWSIPVPQDGIYPVYVQFRAGANRSSVARFTVHHTGGSTLYQIDQTLDDRTWVRLGDHAFSQ